MTENNQDQTMEEILASIRRIISEDEAVAAAPAHDGDGPLVLSEDDVLPPEPAPGAEPEAEIHDPETPEARPEAPPEMSEPPAMSPPQSPTAAEPDALVSAPAASSAALAFGALERSVAMPAPGRSLEDVVREMLRPMLKAWLDEHLPAIVQAQVAAEVERIARQRR
jgi:cell pole-organizing protein PopZ